MARVSDACSDLVTAISDASLSLTPSVVQRLYAFDYQAHQDFKLGVFVFPSTRTGESIGRNSTLEVHTVEVVIRKPVNNLSVTTEVDSLLGYVDEVADLLMRSDLSTQGQKVLSYTQEEYFDSEALHENHLFVSTIILSIRDQF